jgi:hypothetical protein
MRKRWTETESSITSVIRNDHPPKNSKNYKLSIFIIFHCSKNELLWNMILCAGGTASVGGVWCNPFIVYPCARHMVQSTRVPAVFYVKYTYKSFKKIILPKKIIFFCLKLGNPKDLIVRAHQCFNSLGLSRLLCIMRERNYFVRRRRNNRCKRKEGCRYYCGFEKQIEHYLRNHLVYHASKYLQWIIARVFQWSNADSVMVWNLTACCG